MLGVWNLITVLLPQSPAAAGIPAAGEGLCGEAQLLRGRRLPAEGGLCLAGAVTFGLKSMDPGFKGLDGREELGVVLLGFAELAFLVQGAEGEDNNDGAGKEEEKNHVGKHGTSLANGPDCRG